MKTSATQLQAEKTMAEGGRSIVNPEGIQCQTARSVGKRTAFTLIELLVVLAIMGLLAALALPSMKGMRQASGMAAASQQLLDDAALARRLAIQTRTTVLMLFLPPQDAATAGAFNTLSQSERNILLRGQLTSYALYSTRQVGDQPGQAHPRYLKPWTALPDGFMIPQWKFTTGAGFDVSVPVPNSSRFYQFLTMEVTVPSLNSASPVDVEMPYIAFGPEGRLQRHAGNSVFVDLGEDEVLPLARGSLFLERDAQGNYAWTAPDAAERPAGNSTNNYNLVVIDHLTARGRLVRPETK